ncbi:MAG: M56 family metallopeptidase, partial [Hymenobacteraceae bacterium]|nr:M56 family metallopeptidase [Hymenobacteraceae bacterium]
MMEPLLNYGIKSGICLLTLYLFYYGLLRSQNNFRFNRLYLLLAPPVALLLPLIKWPAVLAPETAVSQALQVIQLSEITVTAYRQENAAPSQGIAILPYLLYCAYLLGALVVLIKLFQQLWQVNKVKAQATPSGVVAGKVQVYRLQGHYPTFAFGRSIFLSRQEHLNQEEQEQVLAHELAHVRLRHTWDVLFYELLSAVLWVNPLIWLLKKELRDVHEYQADATVITSHQAKHYSALLSREALLNMGLPVGSHFQKPQVLKRLAMLQQHGQEVSWLRPLLALPLLGGLMLFFSLQQADAEAAIKSAAALQLDGPAPAEQSPVAQKPEAKPAVSAELKEELEKEPAIAKERPYTYVEQMPQFAGGEGEMLKFLAMNIRYPKDAQENGT